MEAERREWSPYRAVADEQDRPGSTQPLAGTAYSYVGVSLNRPKDQVAACRDAESMAKLPQNQLSIASAGSTLNGNLLPR